MTIITYVEEATPWNRSSCRNQIGLLKLMPDWQLLWPFGTGTVTETDRTILWPRPLSNDSLLPSSAIFPQLKSSLCVSAPKWNLNSFNCLSSLCIDYTSFLCFSLRILQRNLNAKYRLFLSSPPPRHFCKTQWQDWVSVGRVLACLAYTKSWGQSLGSGISTACTRFTPVTIALKRSKQEAREFKAVL
jgi:hypothetical protein